MEDRNIARLIEEGVIFSPAQGAVDSRRGTQTPRGPVSPWQTLHLG